MPCLGPGLRVTQSDDAAEIADDAENDAKGADRYRHDGRAAGHAPGWPPPGCPSRGRPPPGCELSFAEFLDTVENPDLRAVALHWNEARGSKKMPGWSDIDPGAIGRQLRIVWSWKYDRATDRFTGRLAGEDINAIFGKNLRGADMQEFFKDWNYDAIFARHKKVIGTPCLCHGKGLVFIHAGRYGSGERVVLPLASDGEHGDGIIGATVYHSMQRGLAETSDAPSLDAEDVTFYSL